MRLIGSFGAISLLIALAGCVSGGDGGPPRLSFAPADQTTPADELVIVPGAAAHDGAYLNPVDPSDQQNNQGHGLGMGPDDPAYFGQFLRF